MLSLARIRGAASRCPEVRRQLTAYVEDELAEPARQRVASHLESCEDCRMEEASLREALALLSAPRSRVLPGDLYVGFTRRLAEAEQASGVRRLRLQWAAGLGVLMLAAGVSAGPLRGLLAPRTDAPPAAIIVPRAGARPAVRELIQPDRRGALPRPQRPEPVESAAHDDAAARLAKEAARRQDRQRPQPRQAARGSSPAMPESFLAVRPKVGPSAAEILAARQRALEPPAASDQASRPPTLGPDAPGPTELEPMPAVTSKDQVVEIGGTVSRIRASYRTDRSGRRTGVEIHIETTVKPSDAQSDR